MGALRTSSPLPPRAAGSGLPGGRGDGERGRGAGERGAVEAAAALGWDSDDAGVGSLSGADVGLFMGRRGLSPVHCESGAGWGSGGGGVRGAGGLAAGLAAEAEGVDVTGTRSLVGSGVVLSRVRGRPVSAPRRVWAGRGGAAGPGARKGGTVWAWRGRRWLCEVGGGGAGELQSVGAEGGGRRGGVAALPCSLRGLAQACNQGGHFRAGASRARRGGVEGGVTDLGVGRRSRRWARPGGLWLGGTGACRG